MGVGHLGLCGVGGLRGGRVGWGSLGLGFRGAI